MNKLYIDQYNQLLGVPCHDGLLKIIDVSKKPVIKICISDSAEHEFEIFIESVKYFYLSNFREGNVIDRMYLWSLKDVPKTTESNLIKNFNIDATEKLASKSGKNNFVLFLECSYGAELFAVIEDESDMKEYIKKFE